jgi:hypothetical protein
MRSTSTAIQLRISGTRLIAATVAVRRPVTRRMHLAKVLPGWFANSPILKEGNAATEAYRRFAEQLGEMGKRMDATEKAVSAMPH